MHSDAFESAFDTFLESRTYDQANQAIFNLVREAFEAGFEAGRGNIRILMPQNIKTPRPLNSPSKNGQ